MKIKNDMSISAARAQAERLLCESLGTEDISELENEGWVLDWAPAPCGGLQFLVGEPTWGGGAVGVLVAPVALVSAAGQVTWLVD